MDGSSLEILMLVNVSMDCKRLGCTSLVILRLVSE